jgi:hypothetical protein
MASIFYYTYFNLFGDIMLSPQYKLVYTKMIYYSKLQSHSNTSSYNRYWLWSMNWDMKSVSIKPTVIYTRLL